MAQSVPWFAQNYRMKPPVPTGIHQITLRVNDIARADAFYSETLGFRLQRKMGRGMSVFRLGGDTLVLTESETAYDDNARDYRVDHFGFRLDTDEAVDEWAAWFRHHDVPIVTGPMNRKNGRFLFVTDPDGNLIEFYSEHDA
jgi:catechol-2,3-dioxygenase